MSAPHLQSLGSLCTTFQTGVAAVLAAAERAGVAPDALFDGVGYFNEASVERIRAELLPSPAPVLAHAGQPN